MGELKRVAREVEVRRSGWPWAELGPVVSAYAKRLAANAWEEAEFSERMIR